MKITIEHYDVSFSAEFSDESTATETLDKIVSLLVATGYHKDSVNRALSTLSADTVEISDEFKDRMPC